ncbi:MAG: Maf family protein [Faecousia sp.]
MHIILASQSPRRRELLELMGLEFQVRVADIDETMDLNADPADEVARVSAAKANAVAAGPEDLVLAADTIVVCQGRILGKPHSPREAREMLELLSGRDHQVMTGYTLRQGDKILTHTEVSHIHFRPLLPEEIHAYVETGEPMDKAGAYGIQGKAALFVSRLEGDYYNVMGLPLCALTQSLRDFGVKILGV